MDKQKLETKLEQVQIKRNAIFADIESLRINEQEADKEIACIKAEIETLDEPELRHGDYGAWSNLTKEPRLYVEMNGKIAVTKQDGTIPNSDINETGHPFHSALGNIFDDLAIISKPLHSFKRNDLAGQNNNSFGFTLSGETIDFNGESYTSFKLSEVKSLIMNLRRLVVTFEAKDSK